MTISNTDVMSELEILQKKLDEIKAVTVLSVKKAYTVEESALYLGMSPEYIKRMCKARKIKSYRSCSGKIYLHQSDLDKWMLHTEVITKDELDDKARLIARNVAKSSRISKSESPAYQRN